MGGWVGEAAARTNFSLPREGEVEPSNASKPTLAVPPQGVGRMQGWFHQFQDL